jgi:hypothetical protein
MFQLMPSGKHMAGLDWLHGTNGFATVQSFGLNSSALNLENLNIELLLIHFKHSLKQEQEVIEPAHKAARQGQEKYPSRTTGAWNRDAFG